MVMEMLLWHLCVFLGFFGGPVTTLSWPTMSWVQFQGLPFPWPLRTLRAEEESQEAIVDSGQEVVVVVVMLPSNSLLDY